MLILALLPAAGAMPTTITQFCVPQLRPNPHRPTHHQIIQDRQYPVPPLLPPSSRPDLLTHAFTLMSLNCNGLQPRTTGPQHPRGHYVEKRTTLAELVASQRPTFLALQETWHMPQNDRLDIPNYRWRHTQGKRPCRGRSPRSGELRVTLVDGHTPRWRKDHDRHDVLRDKGNSKKVGP